MAVRMLFCNSPSPRHLLFAHVCRKFRISGSPRCRGAPAEIARLGWMARGFFTRHATGDTRKRWMILLGCLVDWFLVGRRRSVQHQFYRANDREKAAPTDKITHQGAISLKFFLSLTNSRNKKSINITRYRSSKKLCNINTSILLIYKWKGKVEGIDGIFHKETPF